MTPRSIAKIGAAKARPGSWEFSASNVSSGSVGADIDPIIAIDHFKIRVPVFAPHPHAGFSAVTYLFEDGEGEFISRDSAGHEVKVRPGAVIWNKAASGVIHEEFPAVDGQLSHGLQIFISLPAALKMDKPALYYADGPDVPVLNPPGAKVRIVAGHSGGVTAAIEPPGDITLLDIRLTSGGSFSHVEPQDNAALVYVITGTVQLAGVPLQAGQAALLAHDGDMVDMSATEAAHAVLLAGPRLHEPMVQHGPFVMTSAAEIEAAIRRYQSGQMGHLASAGKG